MTDKRTPAGLLLDLDGTLYVGDGPVPGAVEAVTELAERGFPRRYLTNTTRFSRRELAERLTGMGFPIGVDEIFTASVSAAESLRQRDVRRIELYLPTSARADFAGFDVTADAPEAIVIGDLGAEWTFERLNRAFRQVTEGAEIVALQKNRYWKTGDGLTLDAGPFVAALEYATGERAEVVGKPTRRFFDLVAGSLGVQPGELAMVGDDVDSDVGGAQRAGMRGALVRTGKFTEDALRRSPVEPDWIADSVAELVRQWFP